MKLEELSSFYKQNIVIDDGISYFSLKKTFESGECFRWEALSCNLKEAYIGVIFGTVCIVIYNTDGKSIDVYTKAPIEKDLLINYFDLRTSYKVINQELINLSDENINRAIETGLGIRILNQDFYETLISFIISANNNIPRIKKCINAICKQYGDYITTIDDCDYYTFPKPETLANVNPEILQSECRVGYRAPYIVKASKQYLDKEVSNWKISNANIKDADKEIMKYMGVGSKVANCIMLFSGLRRDSFPVDVWVERMLIKLYGLNGMSRENMEKWGKEKFGKNSGIAQQYLFYYIRETENN